MKFINFKTINAKFKLEIFYENIMKKIFSVFAGNSKVIKIIEKFNGGKVVILMYHRVNFESDFMGLSVSPDFFELQIQYLLKNYEIISLESSLSILDSECIHDQYIVITFDDGFRDNFTEVYPLLKKYNVPATIFVACDAIDNGYIDWHLLDHAVLSRSYKELDLVKFGMGRIPVETEHEKQIALLALRRRLKQAEHSLRKDVIDFIVDSSKESFGRIMLTWDEVNELVGDGLISIGAHTMSHPILSRISLDDARFEIFESKRKIQEKTGAIVKFFAYPNGQPSDFNADIVALVKNAGFRCACTTNSGINRSGSDLFRLKRIDVTNKICMGRHEEFSSEMFGAYISGEYAFFTGFGSS